MITVEASFTVDVIKHMVNNSACPPSHTLRLPSLRPPAPVHIRIMPAATLLLRPFPSSTYLQAWPGPGHRLLPLHELQRMHEPVAVQGPQLPREGHGVQLSRVQRVPFWQRRFHKGAHVPQCGRLFVCSCPCANCVRCAYRTQCVLWGRCESGRG